MNENSYYDFKLFIKKNLKIILLSVILVTLFVISLFTFKMLNDNDEVLNDDYVINEVIPNIENSNDFENLSPEKNDALTQYLSKESFSFRIYIENENSNVFNDNNLVKEVLIEESVLQRLDSETNYSFDMLPEVAVSVFNIKGTSMMQIKIGTGDYSKNKEIADFYYQLLQNKDIPLFENKSVYFVDSEPVVFEEMNDSEAVNEEEPLSNLEIVTSNLDAIFIVLIMGLVGGSIIGIIISLLIDFFSNKITSIYKIDAINNIKIVYLDRIFAKADKKALTTSLVTIFSENTSEKLILSEYELNKDFQNQLAISEQNIQNSRNIEGLDVENIEEIIVLVGVYDTTKQWIQRELEILRGINVKVKIIRIPKYTTIINK